MLDNVLMGQMLKLASCPYTAGQKTEIWGTETGFKHLLLWILFPVSRIFTELLWHMVLVGTIARLQGAAKGRHACWDN